MKKLLEYILLSLFVLFAVNFCIFIWVAEAYNKYIVPDSVLIDYRSITKLDMIQWDKDQIIISTRSNTEVLVADFYGKTICNNEPNFDEDWESAYLNVILPATDWVVSLVWSTKARNYPAWTCETTILVDIHLDWYKKRLKPIVTKFTVYE